MVDEPQVPPADPPTTPYLMPPAEGFPFATSEQAAYADHSSYAAHSPYATPSPQTAQNPYAYQPLAQQPQQGAQGGWGQQAGAQQFPMFQSATDQDVNTAHVVIAWIVAVVTFGYMLPWAVAATRGKSNAGVIGLINFFTGWFFGVGWVVALVMACGAHQQRYPVQAMHYQPAGWTTTGPGPTGLPPAAWYPAPDGSGGQAYWDGQQWTGHRA